MLVPRARQIDIEIGERARRHRDARRRGIEPVGVRLRGVKLAFNHGGRSRQAEKPAEDPAVVKVSDLRDHEDVPDAGRGDVDEALALRGAHLAFGVDDVESGRFVPLQHVEPHRPAAAIAVHGPWGVARALLPHGSRVPQHDHRELEPLRLVDGQDAHGISGDRMRAVESLRAIDPVAHALDDGVEVELLRERARLDLKTQLADATQALAAVRAERDRAADAGLLEQRTRGGSRAALEAAPPQFGHNRARLHRTIIRIADARAREVSEVDCEERRAKQRGQRDSVLAVGERAQPEQKAPVDRIAEKQRSTTRGVRHAVAIERVEEPRQVGRGDREDADVPESDRARLVRVGIRDLDPADAHEPSHVPGHRVGFQRAEVGGATTVGRSSATACTVGSEPETRPFDSG